MNKRLLAMFLCLVMLAAMLPGFSGAEDEPAEQPIEWIYASVDESVFPYTNEGLETAYVEQLLYGKSSSLDQSIAFVPDPAFGLTPAESAIEQLLKAQLRSIANCEQTSTELSADLSGYGFSSSELSEVDMSNVVNMLMRDCTAELFWFARWYRLRL